MYNVYTMKNQTMDANTDTPCACCGRTHRKLFLTDYGWLGKTCREHVSFYMRDRNPKSLLWVGYEKQFNKVDRMLTGGKNQVAV